MKKLNNITVNDSDYGKILRLNETTGNSEFVDIFATDLESIDISQEDVLINPKQLNFELMRHATPYYIRRSVNNNWVSTPAQFNFSAGGVIFNDPVMTVCGSYSSVANCMVSIEIYATEAITKKLWITVDDNAYVYNNGSLVITQPIGTGNHNLNLIQGVNLIQIINNNSGGGANYIYVNSALNSSDIDYRLIDNETTFFMAPDSSMFEDY